MYTMGVSEIVPTKIVLLDVSPVDIAHVCACCTRYMLGILSLFVFCGCRGLPNPFVPSVCGQRRDGAMLASLRYRRPLIARTKFSS